jgi:outer membrane receptor protein involved in Fe transport
VTVAGKGRFREELVTHTRSGLWGHAHACLMLFSLLAGGAALAQASTSVLTGNVVDASTKAPVADVVVTASSPSMQGEQVVVTDSTGLYRIPQLPPGTYTLRFEKGTYRPYSRTGIEVPADRTLRLNVEILPETAGAETISVVGSAPTVDVASSTLGATVNQDLQRNLALSRPGGLGGANRSFDSLATVAPEATADVYGVAISGATSPENQYLIDGLSVNNPAYGVLGTPLTAEFVDEVNVVTGGYMPEYGRTTGGTVSAVIKSGGNEFHGSIFGTFTPGSLAGAAAPISSGTGVVTGAQNIGNFGDFGATLGGFIIKDKLWFFAGIQPSFTRYSYTRSFNLATLDANGNQTGDFSPIANSTQRRFADQKSINFVGKLTYLMTQDLRMSLTVFGTPTSGGGGGSFPVYAFNGRSPQAVSLVTGGTFNGSSASTRNDAYDVIGEVKSAVLDKHLLFDVKVGWHHQLDENLPPDGSSFSDIDNAQTLAGNPEVIGSPNGNQNVAALDPSVPASVRQACGTDLLNQACGVQNYRYGGTGFMESLTLDSIQFKPVFTYLFTALGHHVLKAGFEGEWAQYQHQKAYSGRTILEWNPDGSDTLIDSRRFGYLTGSGPADQVTLTGLTANSNRQTIGGFIQDSWSIVDKVTLNVGLRYDTVALKGIDGVVRMSLTDQISPRVGLVWDPTQQGRSKLFANYGRYFENIPLDIADRELQPEAQISGLYDPACNPTAPGAYSRCASSPNQLLNRATRPNRYWRVTGTPDVVPVDPELKSPANDEIVAGAEYEVFANARVGVSYKYRNLVRTVEDMSNDEANTYFIGNPGEGIANTFPKAQRTLHAVTVSFTKTFSDLWLAQVSYTWQQLRGNYDGLYRPEDQQLDPNLNSTFDLKDLLPNQYGPLAGDITHTIKVFLAKEFVVLPTFSITLGGSYNGASGAPINYLGAQDLYGPGQAYILTRGSGGRLPWNHSVDVRLALNYRLGKDSVISAGVDAFNVFNSQRPTLVDDNYTFDTVGPIVGATNGTVPTQYGGVCAGPTGPCQPGNGSLPKAAPNLHVALADPTGVPIPVQVNPNWGRPLAYQAVRTFRFSLRYTF